MSKLGAKHTCADCETKYYDLARSEAACPRCGSTNRLEDEERPAPPPRVARAASRRPQAKADEEPGEKEPDEVEEVELPDDLELDADSEEDEEDEEDEEEDA